MCVWTCSVQGNTLYSNIHVDDPLNPILGLYYFIHEILWYIIRLWMETCESICCLFLRWRLISAIAHVGHCHVSNCLSWLCFSRDLHFLFRLCHLFLMLVSCLMTFRFLALEYSSLFPSGTILPLYIWEWFLAPSVVFPSLLRYIALLKNSSIHNYGTKHTTPVFCKWWSTVLGVSGGNVQQTEELIIWEMFDVQLVIFASNDHHQDKQTPTKHWYYYFIGCGVGWVYLKLHRWHNQKQNSEHSCWLDFHFHSTSRMPYGYVIS